MSIEMSLESSSATQSWPILAKWPFLVCTSVNIEIHGSSPLSFDKKWWTTMIRNDEKLKFNFHCQSYILSKREENSQSGRKMTKFGQLWVAEELSWLISIDIVHFWIIICAFLNKKKRYCMIHTFGIRSLKNRQVDQLVQTDMAQRQRGFETRFFFFK